MLTGRPERRNPAKPSSGIAAAPCGFQGPSQAPLEEAISRDGVPNRPPQLFSMEMSSSLEFGKNLEPIFYSIVEGVSLS